MRMQHTARGARAAKSARRRGGWLRQRGTGTGRGTPRRARARRTLERDDLRDRVHDGRIRRNGAALDVARVGHVDDDDLHLPVDLLADADVLVRLHRERVERDILLVDAQRDQLPEEEGNSRSAERGAARPRRRERTGRAGGRWWTRARTLATSWKRIGNCCAMAARRGAGDGRAAEVLSLRCRDSECNSAAALPDHGSPAPRASCAFRHGNPNRAGAAIPYQ